MSSEEWRSVSDWPEYEVSNFGNVRRVTKAMGATPMKKLRPGRMKNGYLLVSLSRYPLRKCVLVHRLVARAFIGDIPDSMDVCHNDGVRDNNCADNLRIDTRSGNMADVVAHGTHIRGERCGSNKYRTEHVRALRAMMDGGQTPASLSRETGIPVTTLYAIKDRRTWSWL